MRDPHPSPVSELRLVDDAPALVTTAERRLAAEHWLLSTLDSSHRDRARREWQEAGVALLPLGTLFSAVRIPGTLLVALTGSTESKDLDEFLRDALDGGPVICDPHRLRYYALVPASMPVTWTKAVDEWRASLDVDVLGRGCHLGVPKVDAVDLNPKAWATYWSVPMASAASLCAPLHIARLIAAGAHELAEDDEL